MRPGPHPNPQHWRKLTTHALTRDRGCRLCGSVENLHLHHRTYERFGQEEDTDVTILCEKCHKVFHRYRSTKG